MRCVARTASACLLTIVMFFLTGCHAYGGGVICGPSGCRQTIRYAAARPWLVSDEELERRYDDLPPSLSVSVAGFSGLGAEQQDPEWCWAAAIESVLEYADVAATQQDIVSAVFPNASRRRTNTATLGDILEGLNRFVRTRYGMTRMLSPVVLQANAWNNIQLINTINQNYPVIVGLKGDGAAAGHVVVVHELEYREFAPYQLGISSVTFYDPWYGTDDTLSGAEFIDRVQFAVATNVY